MGTGQAVLLRKIDEVIGAYTLTMCHEHYLTDEEVCFELNISPNRLKQIKGGRKPISASEFYLLCNMMEVTPNFFFKDMLRRIEYRNR